MALPFDQLVGALAGAVVEAQHQVRQAHIGELWNFFREGAPLAVDLHVPRVNPSTGHRETTRLNVPLITLVNPSQLSIQEMQVNLQVDMSEITRAAVTEQVKGAVETVAPTAHVWTPVQYKPLMAATTTGSKPAQVGTAQITLTISAEEPPEGLAKLLNHLNTQL